MIKTDSCTLGRAFFKNEFFTAFVLYLLVLNFSRTHSLQLGKECNSSTQYFNQSTNECMDCTNCEVSGLLVYENCTSTSNSICYLACSESQYYDNVTGQCTECSVCSSVKDQCTPITDTICHDCSDMQTYESGMCVTDCSKCEHGCTINETRCACGPDEYFDDSADDSTGTCATCTDCSAAITLQECTLTTNAVCRELCPDGQYYDMKQHLCTNCTHCALSTERSACTATSDAMCCPSKEFYNTAVRSCTPICDECPSRKCEEGNSQQCKCLECQTGRLCDEQVRNCPATDPMDDPTDPGTRGTEANSVTISPVASALIALGAVIGIILFSALFVLLGVASSCRKGSNEENDSFSNNSVEKFLEDGKTTSSLVASLYKQNPMAYNEYRTNLDLARLSGSGRSLHSNSSSSRSSPKSPRTHTPSLRHCRDHNSLTPV